MFAGARDTYWIGFVILVLVVIVIDLIAFRAPDSHDARHDGRASGTARNLLFFLFVLAVAAGFWVWLAHASGRENGLEFASGYLIEISLSIDNLFVFMVLFRAFGLTLAEQRKALFYGVLGAIMMRCVFIVVGAELLQRVVWIEFIFGGFLLIAAFRLLSRKASSSPSGWIGWLTKRAGGDAGGRLLGAIVAIELVDLIFALDSIPAVLAVTSKPFVAYSSNILAVLGLRSLYFLLASALGRLRYLRFGLAGILIFVGIKMTLRRWVHIPVGLSLGVILGLALIATAASLLRSGPNEPHLPA